MPIVTNRDFTVDDLIVEFEDTMRREGRTFCPITEKLKKMRDAGLWTGTEGVDHYEKWVFKNPELAIPVILDVIRVTGTHHPPDVTADIQTAYAKQLATYPWELVRPGLEVLLRTKTIAYGIAPEASRILLDLIRDNHPNAKAFVMQPVVYEKIPDDIDLSDWTCADFPDLENAFISGGRDCSCPVHSPNEEPLHTQLTEFKEFSGVVLEPGHQNDGGPD